MEDERAKFEEWLWFSGNRVITEEYGDPRTSAAWDAWQARALLASPQAAGQPVAHLFRGDCGTFTTRPNLDALKEIYALPPGDYALYAAPVPSAPAEVPQGMDAEALMALADEYAQARAVADSDGFTNAADRDRCAEEAEAARDALWTALAARPSVQSVAPQEAPLADVELPGMWESADFLGGQEEVRPARQSVESGTLPKEAPAKCVSISDCSTPDYCLSVGTCKSVHVMPASVRASADGGADSPLSNFVRNASPEKKAEVYEKVMDRATASQLQTLGDGGADSLRAEISDAELFKPDRLEVIIDEYLEDYEMRGETEDGRDAGYTPNEGDLALIKDAILGLLAHPEWDEEWGKLINQRVAELVSRSAVPAHAQGSEPGEDARDAKRYRALRGSLGFTGRCLTTTPLLCDPLNREVGYLPEGLDKAMDELLAATSPKTISEAPAASSGKAGDARKGGAA